MRKIIISSIIFLAFQIKGQSPIDLVEIAYKPPTDAINFAYNKGYKLNAMSDDGQYSFITNKKDEFNSTAILAFDTHNSSVIGTAQMTYNNKLSEIQIVKTLFSKKFEYWKTKETSIGKASFFINKELGSFTLVEKTDHLILVFMIK